MDWMVENPHVLALLKLAAKLGAAFLLGCAGGITLDLIQFKGGLELPNCYPAAAPGFVAGARQWFFDIGFFAELLVGGTAGVVVFCLKPAVGILPLIANSLLAGIGGGSLLLSFTNALRLRTAATEAVRYRDKLKDVQRMVQAMRAGRATADAEAANANLDLIEKSLGDI